MASSVSAFPCKQAALKQLPKNKVPNMAVMIKSLTRSTVDASVVFKDPTGKEWVLGVSYESPPLRSRDERPPSQPRAQTLCRALDR